MTAAPVGVPHPLEEAPSRAIAVALPKAMQRYARSTVRWRIGCDVTPLRDGGETYAAMLAAIASARQSICCEVYILASDRTGERFRTALVERARAGVTVRLMYDAVGSFGLADSWLGELRDAGAQVVVFNPIAPWRARWGLSHRDHRKILVVDDEVAFTGGLNIANDYASVEDGGAGWHDAHCLVRGPIVLDLARLFRRTWLRAGGDGYPPPASPNRSPGVGGSSFVRMIENTTRRKRPAIRRAYVHVIKAARQRVWIENAYFLPDRGLRRALVRAVRRGVDVRVIVPGHSDVRLIEWASLYVMRRLARRGVKLLRWRGVMLHAKTAVVDGVWSTIGSYNFDAQSRFNNLEVTIEILDPAVGGALETAFERDVAQCDAFDEDAWKHLPWWRKAFAWLAYRLRRFL
ncbi:MAG: phospholipase D-like domain-containing protein [Acidobacteriota bacterium]